MPQIDALSLIGTANYVNPDEPKNDARLALKGLGLANLPLIREKSFPLTVKHAIGNLNLDLATVGDVLDAAVKADFNTVQFTADTGEEKTAIASAIAAAITGVDRFALKAGITGTMQAYTVDVKSDLDQVLKSAVGNLVSAESAKFQAALKEQINSRLKQPMAQTQGSLADLDAIAAELSKRLNLGDNLLKGLKLPF